MFGHEKGAFTGALSVKKGRFELADEGTILLDEISEMSPALQAKFLRVLQNKTFERLGSMNTLRTGARIIAATNRDLQHMVAEGRFREDLFYRLNIFPITLPPLRERTESLETLSRYIVGSVSARLGRQPGIISPESLKAMKDYQWPGNIRELENVIERAILVSKGPELEIAIAGAIPSRANSGMRPGDKSSTSDLKSLEKEAISETLARCGGNRKAAALELGISLRSLHYKIKEYGLK
jgi:transcriptional regulator with PAS, ATPase and Fis domain